MKIADLGCGEGRLGEVLRDWVSEINSFDLVSIKPHITVANSLDVSNFQFLQSKLHLDTIEGLKYECHGVLSITDVDWFNNVDKIRMLNTIAKVKLV